jgi:2,4-dienoyl-CoA reductase-like NADH-dependent reductase (Old Yellow Enzyme family)
MHKKKMDENSHRKHKVFTPAKLGGAELKNRIIRTAAFEGMCPDGAPSEGLVEHHRAVARGGAAMTTVAYCSVSSGGRTYGHQMHMRAEIIPGLKKLTGAVHAEGALSCLQLGHAGYFAGKKVIGTKPLAPSRLFNLYGLSFSKEMDKAEISRATRDFVEAAELSRQAGFDAVELHLGHGYLLSQFLSPYTNRREDGYGGTLENRMRFPVETLRATRKALGPDFPILAKMNLEDGFKGGLEIDEAVQIARALEENGASALVLSGGFVSKTPLFMLRGNVPVKEMAGAQKSLFAKIGLTMFGRIFVQTYKFENLFFLENAKKIRAAVKLPLVLVGGVCSLSDMEKAMDEGFDFVALGRALIRDPDFVNKLKRGEITASDCDHCNICIAEMDRGGVRCVLPR